jgi:NAD+ synthase (glutamine-hydrolysing)
LKIALVQMDVIPGRPKQNFRNMKDIVLTHEADLWVFPEMCIGGYLVGDKWQLDSFCKNLMEFNLKVQQLSGDRNTAIAFGNIFFDEEINQRVGDDFHHPHRDGRVRKYNATVVFDKGKPGVRVIENYILPPGVQPKTLLPNYRFFDDERYFTSLRLHADDFSVPLKKLLQPFLINGEKIGFGTCEDLWCEDYRTGGKSLNPTKILIENGANYIINLSASPWTIGKDLARDNRIKFLKQDCGDNFKPFFYVNCTGVQNNGKNIVTFDKGLDVYNTNAEPVSLAQIPFRQEIKFIDTDHIDLMPVVERQEKSIIGQKCDAIIRAIHHIKEIKGWDNHPKYLLGLSGGVDSAVSAALLSLAVGPENVLGVNMPNHSMNSQQTKDAAMFLAKQLGINYGVIPIGELVSLNEKIINSADFYEHERKLNVLQKGNIAAKIRGTNILSNLAALYGMMFTNNGNKLEVALGYATLYGDVNGAIAPIADLTKAEVFEMARYLNETVFKKEVIPGTLLPDELFRFSTNQIKPTAELEVNQEDPMYFGYHDAILTMMTDYRAKSIENVMEMYLDGTLHYHLAKALNKDDYYGYRLMLRWGVDDPKHFVENIEWFSKTVDLAVFKRIQGPPIPITSKTAYGYDRRESQLPYETTLEHDRLREKILATITVYNSSSEIKENKLVDN